MELEEAIKNCNSIVYFCENNKECQENEFCPDCYIEIEDVKAIKTILQALDNSIPKKKIEDKIKAYEKLIDDVSESERYSHEIPLYRHDILVLQELLEDK